LDKCPECKKTDKVRHVEGIIAEQAGLTASKKRKWFKRSVQSDLAAELSMDKDPEEIKGGLGNVGCGIWLLLAGIVNLAMGSNMDEKHIPFMWIMAITGMV